jgi:hypothetical protein
MRHWWRTWPRRNFVAWLRASGWERRILFVFVHLVRNAAILGTGSARGRRCFCALLLSTFAGEEAEPESEPKKYEATDTGTDADASFCAG